jgi:PleD family two-component response regulator
MQHADIAMYRAKRNGRARYEVFTKDLMQAYTNDS